MAAHLCAISAPGWGALQLPSGKVFLDLLLCKEMATKRFKEKSRGGVGRKETSRVKRSGYEILL